MPIAEPHDKLSIVITDSGLGGLSVCADMVESLSRCHDIQEIAVTYFNAWPEQNRGYNLLPDMAERIRVFNRALSGMEHFEPDVIFIACNTLSTIYAQTEFSRRAPMPVVDIIDFGVRMMLEQLDTQPDSRVIILGTPTTIAANTHRSRLIEKGIPGERIIVQPCDRLAGEIEKDPLGATVHAMIADYIGQAAASMADRRSPVLTSLCCTHYGYSQAVFQAALEANFSGSITILNPNQGMGALFADREQGPARRPIEIQVVSRIEWSDMKVASISQILEGISPMTAAALRRYRHDPDLFTF